MNQNKHNSVHAENSGNYVSTVESLLPSGKENAISTKQLMTILNCSERELRELVARERNRGAIICSDSIGGGYFKPETEEEIRSFIKILQMKADSIYSALRSAKQALSGFDGQQPEQED